MNNNNNKKFIYILIIAVIAIGGYRSFYANKNLKSEQSEKEEEVSKSEIIIKELADKYQAETNWEEDLDYTIQAQERLVTGRPSLFTGYVDDVFKHDEKTFIRFSTSYLSPVDYLLELECTQEIVDKFFAQKQNDEKYFNFFDEHAIVADIKEVNKLVFRVDGSVLSEDEVEIDIESSNVFIAKGTCIDIAYIGDE